MKVTKVNIKHIRNIIADYMRSEGCSCCRDINAHDKNTARLGKVLNVPMYKDKSGYDFRQFSTEARKEKRQASKCGKKKEDDRKT